MLKVTQAAGDHLAQILGDPSTPQDVAVRLFLDDRRIGMRLDQERPGDAKITHAGRIILLLDEEIAEVLTGNTLDVEPSEEGPTFTLIEGGEPEA